MLTLFENILQVAHVFHVCAADLLGFVKQTIDFQLQLPQNCWVSNDQETSAIVNSSIDVSVSLKTYIVQEIKHAVVSRPATRMLMIWFRNAFRSGVF